MFTAVPLAPQALPLAVIAFEKANPVAVLILDDTTAKPEFYDLILHFHRLPIGLRGATPEIIQDVRREIVISH
jgi:hypothetical protein